MSTRYPARLPGIEAWPNSTPKRIQRQRTAGWRMPPNTVYVGRGSRWGNPVRVKNWSALSLSSTEAQARIDVVHAFRIWLAGDPHHQDVYQIGNRSYDRRWVLDHLPDLTGRDLACWCPLDRTCHADVLIELANPVEVNRS